jgi:hypothetical protein
MGKWVLMVNVFVLLVTFLLLWAGYQFWIAAVLKNKIFGGVFFLTTLQVQISLKMWLFMKMNPMPMLKEIKWLEIAVPRLSL